MFYTPPLIESHGSADGIGPQARFNFPAAVAVDRAGSVYVADYDNHTIRKIAADGTVSTLAGTAGAKGTADGTGAAARFNHPTGVAVNDKGDVFVVDHFNHAIRKISAKGMVTTMAGHAGQAGSVDGKGTDARFKFPSGIARDRYDNLYVADGFNHTVRKITPDGAVTTLAGSPGRTGMANGQGTAARFFLPWGVAVDASGNVYVTDITSSLIRKISPQGMMTTLADSPDGFIARDARFHSPHGIAVDRKGGLYISDTWTNTIRKLEPNGQATILAGGYEWQRSEPGKDGVGRAAVFRSPQGIALDHDGNLLVADFESQAIRKVTPKGEVTTLAGALGNHTSSPEMQGMDDAVGAEALVVDDSGTIFAIVGYAILKITPTGETTVLAGSIAGDENPYAKNALSCPSSLALDCEGNLYVADTGNRTIQKIKKDGHVATLAGSPDENDRWTSKDGVGSNARFILPVGVAADSSGNLYVTDLDSDRSYLRKITPDGAVTTLAGGFHLHGGNDGKGESAGFGRSSGVAVDRLGTIYVADATNGSIRKISPDGNVTTLAGTPSAFCGRADGVGPSAQFNKPSSVAVDGDLNVYVADTRNHTIRKISPEGVVTTFAGKAGVAGAVDGVGADARFDYPGHVTVDSAGSVYVSDASTIRKISPAGLVMTLIKVPQEAPRFVEQSKYFDDPGALTLDERGNLYVADDNKLYKITPAGVVTRLLGKNERGEDNFPLTPFDRPAALIVDGHGNILGLTPREVMKYTPDGVVTRQKLSEPVTVSSQSAFSSQKAEAKFEYLSNAVVDDAGNIFLSDPSGVRRVTPDGEVKVWLDEKTEAEDDTGYRPASYGGKNGMAVDQEGNLYVASENALWKVSPQGKATVVVKASDENGVHGFAGECLAVDGNGNVFAGEGGVVLKITPEGRVTVFAGSLKEENEESGNSKGTTLRFEKITGLAASERGDVYVADEETDMIYKITREGEVMLFSGQYGGDEPLVAAQPRSGWVDGPTSAARFRSPTGLARDRQGNFYVTDHDNHTIRKISSQGVVTTLAGTAGEQSGYPESGDGRKSEAIFENPLGLAVDAGGNVFVADEGKHTIRKIAPDGETTTFAGSGKIPGVADGVGQAARFQGARDVTIDESGNLYVADTGNRTIRKINPDGNVSTVPGLGSYHGSVDGKGTAARFDGVNGIAADASGNVYVADAGSRTIRKISADGATSTLAGAMGQAGSADGMGTAARFDHPAGLVVDSHGNVFVADSAQHTIRKITLVGEVTTFAGAASQVGDKDGVGTEAHFKSPLHLAIDRGDNLYVGDYGNNRVRKITPDGVVSTLAGRYGTEDGKGAKAGFRYINGLAVNTSGWVFVNDEGRLRKISPDGEVATWRLEPSTQDSRDLDYSVHGMAFDDHDTLYLVCRSMVLQVAPSGKVALADFMTQQKFAPKLFNLAGFALDRAGNIYFADSDVIRKVSPEGAMTTLAGKLTLDKNSEKQERAIDFGAPSALTRDRRGNIYFVSEGKHAIWKLTPSGDLTLFAGTPEQAGSGDGTGSVAQFNQPYALTVDRNGNVYVSDAGNSAIRKITPAGVVTTLAVPAGQVGQPAGLVTDEDGNVYFADRGCDRICKVTPQGAVVTVAGVEGEAYKPAQGVPIAKTPEKTIVAASQSSSDEHNHSVDGKGVTARFSEPRGIAIGRDSTLFVADAKSHTIRKIAIDGTVTTFAGSASATKPWGEYADGSGDAARFRFPRGLVMDSVGNLYVADSGSHAIRRITPDGEVSTFVGIPGHAGHADGIGDSAQFNLPAGLALEKNGDLIVADAGNHAIRRVTPAGAVSTVAGGGGDREARDFDGSRINGRGHADGVGLSASFQSPSGVAVDGSGNIYVADTDNDTIRKVTPAGEVTTLAGSPRGNVQSNEPRDGVGSLAQFDSPQALTIDDAGNLYVAEKWSKIRKVTPAGVVTTVVGLIKRYEQPEAQLGEPSAIARAEDGTLYVADAAWETIFKVAPDEAVSKIAGKRLVWGAADGPAATAHFESPYGITLDASGTIYVSDVANHTLRKITVDENVITVAGDAKCRGNEDGEGAEARFSAPNGLTMDTSGNVYLGDFSNHAIRKITPEGVVTTLAGARDRPGHADGSLAEASFDGPNALAFDSTGNLYVADEANGTIRKISTQGKVTTLAGCAKQYGSTDGLGAAARFGNILGLAVDASGNVFVTDTYNHTIRKIMPDGLVTTFAGKVGEYGLVDGKGTHARFFLPGGLAIDKAGNLYVGDDYNYSIRKITPDGDVTTLAKVGSTDGVAVDAGGNVYATERFTGSTIKKITPAGVVTDLVGPSSQRPARSK